MADDRPANWNPWNPWTWVPMPGDEPLADTAWPSDPRWPQSRGIYLNPGDRRYRGAFGGTAPGGPPPPGPDTGALSKNEVMLGNQSVMPYGGYGGDQPIYPDRAQEYGQTTIDMQRLLGALDPTVRVEGGPQEYGVNAPAHQPLPQIFDAVPWARPQKQSSTPVTPQELMSMLDPDVLRRSLGREALDTLGDITGQNQPRDPTEAVVWNLTKLLGITPRGSSTPAWMDEQQTPFIENLDLYQRLLAQPLIEGPPLTTKPSDALLNPDTTLGELLGGKNGSSQGSQ